MTPPFLEFKNVTFSYGKNLIFDKINFTIQEGDFVCVIGGSGSGKSTLLKLIAGLIHPDDGEILINGQSSQTFSTEDWEQYRKNMGFLFQQGALFTDLTVEENIAYPIKEHLRCSKQVTHEKVLEVLKAVDLTTAGAKLPAELSGGMLKRAALARAIALNPKLVLYDEPFSGLDPVTLKLIASLIRKINHTISATSIMVTHHVKESLPLAQQILFLVGGKILFSGSAKELKQSSNPVIQEFLQAATVIDKAYVI